MDFEKNLVELERIVEKMERSEITINQGITLFEQGIALTKECLNALTESKGKISIIKKEMDKLIQTPFQEE